MPLATQTPTLHKGPGHPGPAVTFALRGPKDGLGPGQKRRGWDDRHQVLWPNDAMNPNMRSYFDRFVDRMDVPVAPRRSLRPIWVNDVPENEPTDGVYRIFNARTATFEEQTQWAHLTPPPKPGKGKKDKSKKGGALSGASETAGPLTLASQASSPAQLPKAQQQKKEDESKRDKLEQEWDKHHATVFSRFNDRYQVNVRSYFGRWKEDEGKNYGNPTEPNWKLPPERKVILVRTLSEPAMQPSSPQWVGNF